MSNLVLDSQKFKKLMNYKEKAKKLFTKAHGNRYLVQRKAVSKQREYDIALEF